MFPEPMHWLESDYLALCVLPDGKLLITLTSEGWNNREYFLNHNRYYAAWYNLMEYFVCNGYEYTSSVDSWDQMSDAPGFSDAVFTLDNGDVDVRHFWYYGNYQIKDELEELFNKGYVIFDYFDCEGK